MEENFKNIIFQLLNPPLKTPYHFHEDKRIHNYVCRNTYRYTGLWSFLVVVDFLIKRHHQQAVTYLQQWRALNVHLFSERNKKLCLFCGVKLGSISTFCRHDLKSVGNSWHFYKEKVWLVNFNENAIIRFL